MSELGSSSPEQLQNVQRQTRWLVKTLKVIGVSFLFGLSLFGAYSYGKHSQAIQPKPSPSSGLTPTSTIVTPSPIIYSQIVDPETVDIQSLIPENMEFEKNIYLDFNGDEQKEIVAVGKDKLHPATQQAGPQIGMPLVIIYQYFSEVEKWSAVAEVNYSYFPINANVSILSKEPTVISLGEKQGLVFTHFVSSSRSNARFFAIVSGKDKIEAYPFPEIAYQTQGGKTPHTATVTLDGIVTTLEGIYKETDANCCPTGGTLKGTFRVTEEGIKLESLSKEEFNVSF